MTASGTPTQGDSPLSEQSVDQTRPSTRALKVDEALARGMAGFMFADPDPIIDAFSSTPPS